MKLRYLLFALVCFFQMNGFSQEIKTETPQQLYEAYTGVEIYPNPTDGVVWVIYGGNISETETTIEFENRGVIDVYDAQGTAVLRNIQLDKEDFGRLIDMRSWSSGVYFFSLTFDDRDPIIRRIVKK